MIKFITAGLIIGSIVIIMAVVLHVLTVDRVGDRCRPILREQSTSDIRCWSGGVLVYQNNTYYNGGVLCSVEGKQIEIEGSKSLCIIESDQINVWEPPAKR